MAEANRKSSEAESISTARYAKHKLDELDPSRVAKHLVTFRPSPAVVEDLMAKARLSIPGLAETSEVLRVLRYNPGCMMALCRRSRFDPANPVGEGFISILPLRRLGLQILALGSFNATSPDLRLIATEDERPAGIYMWGVFGPGPLAAGMALFMEKISTPQFAGLNLYSRPNTEIGVRFNEVLGFRQGTIVDGIEAPNVWEFSRTGTSPLYDSYVPGAGGKEIGITVARTFDDIMRVAAIRNSVYIGEQECPYTEEYDGNDFSAVHLLAYAGDEPVGCLRLRFFADFAKLERMAIRKEHRKSRAAIQLVQAGLKFCKKKGYRHVYGHIHERLVPFWSRFGFRVKENTRRFVFSDFEYIEIVADIERDPDAITLDNDPYVMIRPEGRWHVPGVLEESALRQAANSSITKK